MSVNHTLSRPGLPSGVILLIFALLLALGYTWYSAVTPYQMGHDQTYVGTMLVKDRDPTLYARDYAFHDDTLYRAYIPLLRWLLQHLTTLTGSFDNALLALVAPAVCLFALGTGLLLLDWSRSLGVALVLTLLAVPYRPAPSGEIWGAGGVEFMLARTLATSLAPFILLEFFRFLGQPTVRRAVITGVSTGLLAFLHPPTALFLGELCTGMFLLCHIRERRQWLFLALLVGSYALAAFVPLTLMERQAPTPVAALDFVGIRQVVHSYLKIPADWGGFPGDATERRVWLFLGATLVLGLNYLLRPGRRPQAALQGWGWGCLIILYLCWRLAGKGAGFTWLYALAAAYVIWRWRRGDLETRDWWLLGMGFVVLAISLLPYYFLTLLWLRFDSLWLTSLVIEHYRAVRLIHPFFYLFSARAAACLMPALAQWLRTSQRIALSYYAVLAFAMVSRLFFGVAAAGIIWWEAWRAWPSRRRILQGGLACVTVLVVLGLALWPGLRHGLALTWSRDLGLHRAAVDPRPDDELFQWARTQTPKDALFFHGSPLFRFRAERSITHALGDLINHREARYVEIFRRYQRLEQAFGDPATLLTEAQKLQADYLIVAKSRPVRLLLPVVFENDRYLVYQLRQPLAGGNLQNKNQ